jgi:hypothetical protein
MKGKCVWPTRITSASSLLPPGSTMASLAGNTRRADRTAWRDRGRIVAIACRRPEGMERSAGTVRHYGKKLSNGDGVRH